MARPLAVAGLSFYGAVMMISFVPGEYRLFTALVISALCLPTVFLFPKALKRFAIVLVCAAVSGAIYFTAYTHIVYYPLIDLKDFQLEDKAALTGEVVDISQASSGYRYIINIHGINGEKIKPRKAIWYSSFKISDYYDIIELEGYLTPDSDGSRLTFDDYWTSQGVYFHLRSYDEPRIFPTKSKPPMYFFRNLRDNISSHIVKQSPLGNSGELVGIMLGEKSFINSSGILAYQRSGIMHILCVSGLHLLMLTTVLFAVLKKIRIPQRISAAIVIIFALSFMALTGFSYPILRSGIMAIIMLSGKIFYRNADSLSSVGLATLFILLINPFAVRSASFTLSLLATLGIIILYPHLKKQVTSKLKSSSTLIKNFVNAFFVSVSAAIFTLPASLLFFDEISIAAPITNALLYPFFTFAMCFGYLAGLFALLPFLPFLSGAAQFMAESALEIIKRICDIIVKIPYAYFPAGFTFLLIWMFGTLLIMLFCAFSKHRSKLYPIAAVISLVILAAGSFSNMYFLRDTVTFTFIETQRGSDVILSYGEKAAIISTAGNDLLSYPGYLRGKGIKDIEALCIIRADSAALR
ncbi:MAG: ComEC/Rec2 family competence protein, partial [Oscillospiraceae bacterium]|nr:ComEC/Rec2 family competence protein [Oscillospiraceae bacterium]